VQALGDHGETVTSPTVAKRDGDRDNLRTAPQWYTVEVANELLKGVVGIQFFDDQL
jgi:hypothetical protein